MQLILLLSFVLHPFENVFFKIGEQFRIDPYLLMAISLKENPQANPKAINYNKNGTKDYGLMQINSIWLPELKEKFGIEKWMLFNPEINIFAGAYILSKCILEFGSTWEAVARYHTYKKERGRRYMISVLRIYLKLKGKSRNLIAYYDF